MSSTIKYKGNTIATAENNTKTLQTSGKYLEGDIEVTDVSSGGNLQAKTGITPTTASQTVTPDSGYDGLSSVQIDAMPAGSYGTPTWSHYISQGSRLLIHPTFPDFDDGYMASAPNSNDTLTLEAQTITPSDSQQVVTPTDLNHYLQRVTVNPITYSASDEGKVVSNGALVAQTSETITENGTYDTTTNDEVVVNVSGGGGEFESGTYIGTGTGNIIREISVTKKWSHFLIVADNTYSQLTSDTTINLYMAYGDEYGYTFVPLKTGDGGYTTNQVQNRSASSYDNWRSQLTFTDQKIRWAFMGNGAIGSPINGATYRWFAW